MSRSILMLAVCGSLFAGSIGWGMEDGVPSGRSPEPWPAVDGQSGVWVVLGLDALADAASVVALSNPGERTVYFQSPDARELAAVRRAAEAAGRLGNGVYVDSGDWHAIHLADNLADAVVVRPSARAAVTEAEVLRVLRPEARGWLGERLLVKPWPEGVDFWPHPYHGPDNNPQSADRVARAPYRTQFMAEPYFVPMPEISVAAGGRVFRAFGHIAHKANQNPWLNTLICVNGFNGTILWRRALPEGFMIHRNTIIATPDLLYLADDRSCKRLDARTGELRDEIVVPDGLADGRVWKWMALVDGTLYALVGGPETPIATEPSRNPGLGHWPWGMWTGHDYADPKTSFGFGRTLLAIDPETRAIRWHYRDEQFIDARGVAMHGGRIYFYMPNQSLGCLDAHTGKVVWRTDDADLLAAIGPNQRAQHYVTGYSTTTYFKASDRYLFFAGPQRERTVAVSADDGRLLWTHPDGNLQLVLRDDAIYAAGPQQTGCILDYATGRVLGALPTRRACTRATGSVDSIFYRTDGGTMRIELASRVAKHIAPMRPPCQDGVIVANGMLYWGPWMCGCQLSFYGHIGLAPAGGEGPSSSAASAAADRLESGGGDPATAAPLPIAAGDWPCALGDPAGSMTARGALPERTSLAWEVHLPPAAVPTPPVTAGPLVFVGDRRGVLQAMDAATGELRWKAYTGAAIDAAPAVWNGRVYTGSADGWLYAHEAATGRILWRYRLAPAQRWINVYGRLRSTWPLAGGVVADGGVVYAAAGIAHYDGTYVAALDAVTGRLRWMNDSSGAISQADSGVSLQGNLQLVGDELQFLAGNVHEFARYDRATGKCLVEPNPIPVSQFRTAFYPYYPEYGKYLSLAYRLPDGRLLEYDASYEGSLHSRLCLLPAERPAQPRKPAERWTLLMQNRPQPPAVWRDPAPRRFGAFAVGDTLLIAAGESPSENAFAPMVTALRIADGQPLWSRSLPASVVPGGLAVNAAGSVFLALENGSLVCLKAERGQ